MIRAQNYETVFKFVKVIPRKLVASFFPDMVYKLMTCKSDTSDSKSCYVISSGSTTYAAF